MQGNICGVTPGFEEKPLAVWPHPRHYSSKVCVSDCSYTLGLEEDTKMALRYKSHKLVYYCIPSPVSNSSVDFSFDFEAGFQNKIDMASRAMGDLYSAWPVLLGSAFIALAATFLVLAGVRKCAGVLVLLCICLVLIAGVVCGGLLLRAGLSSDLVLSEQRKALQIAGGVVLGLTLVFLVVVCFLRKSIRIAVEVVEESASVLFDMPVLVFFPVGPFVIAIGYLAFWVFTALCIYSVTTSTIEPVNEDVQRYSLLAFPDRPDLNGTASAGLGAFNGNPSTMKDFKIVDSWRYYAAYHVFHGLWNMQFIFYFAYLVFAGATADWYFSKRDSAGNKVRGTGPAELSTWPVSEAVGRVLKNHLGTVAITSLIIAIVQFIRGVIKYLEKRTKGTPPNQCQKALFKCIGCCLKCLECCLDKVNKNALVWTAIYGDGFCTAACSSFALVWRNLHRVAAITVVTTLVLTLAKVAVAALTAGVGLIILQFAFFETVSSTILPTVMIFAIGYSVAALFMIVFASVIDTIFLCFLVDAEVNSAGNMFASQELQELVGKYKDESQAKATEEVELQTARGGQKKVADGSYEAAATQHPED